MATQVVDPRVDLHHGAGRDRDFETGPPEGSSGSARRASCLEFERCHAQACRSGTSMKSLVPHGQDEFGIPNGQGAGQMYRIGAPECVQASEAPGMPFNFCGQLDWAGSAPVLVPRLFGCGQAFVTEVMVTAGSRQCCAYLGIRQPARQGGIATIPHISNEVAADLFDNQLHERARIEVDERHSFSAAAHSPELRPDDEAEAVIAR